MKLHLLVCTAALLVAFLPRRQCRPAESGGAAQTGVDPQTDLQQQSLPVLVRMGEEYFIRLGNAHLSLSNVPPDTLSRALQVQLTQRLLQGKIGNVSRLVKHYADQTDGSIQKGKRSEEPPISLDLTFHLLREVLEMARAEQLAQQAHNNRKMMEVIGK
ncbi:corticotropin releasing hormone b [Erpetoichthys calabaricus]|uniref:Corticotropin releasing hormone b n=1 Tax=Erpetoichthys calabaricus TaxID=27687 RepID=A0A8C4RXN8_ERPCA|nr:corticotropin releasing hormone b [Erpetoichthys calabaricus]